RRCCAEEGGCKEGGCKEGARKEGCREEDRGDEEGACEEGREQQERHPQDHSGFRGQGQVGRRRAAVLSTARPPWNIGRSASKKRRSASMRVRFWSIRPRPCSASAAIR